MAIWTRYMGAAAIIGTAFGLFGVALLLLTFMEQRRTSRAELRAYVFPDRVTISDGTGKGLRDELIRVPSVEVVLKNYGNARLARYAIPADLLWSWLNPETIRPTTRTWPSSTGQPSLPPGAEHTHYSVEPYAPPAPSRRHDLSYRR